MAMKSITEAKRLSGKVALVRTDTNVPMEGKRVVDTSRLLAAIPTIRYLQRKHCRVVLVGHLGRPTKTEVRFSLKPIAHTLSKLLREPVTVMPLQSGVVAIRGAAEKNVVLLENIRFEKGENENSLELARMLAKVGNVYVNDAFSVSHRTAASLVSITRYVPSFAGLSLLAEVEALERVKKSGLRPVVVIVGGAKVADKLPVIAKLLPRVSAVLVGGAVANTFLLAKGLKTGTSVVDTSVLRQARILMRKAGKKLVLPLDVVVEVTRGKKREPALRQIRALRSSDRILDTGVRTTQLYATYVKKAQTILWSGPLGLVEQPHYRHSTEALGRLVSARARGKAYVVVGGGDTVAFFHQAKLWVDHVCLAGGAMLDFLAGQPMAALKALGYSSRSTRSK